MWNWARLQRRTVVVAPTDVIGTVYPSALECSTAWERYFQCLKPFWSPWLCLLEFLSHFLSGFTILEMQNKTVWLAQFTQQHLGERCLKILEVSASWMSITRPPHGRKHPQQEVQVNTCHSTVSTSEKKILCLADRSRWYFLIKSTTWKYFLNLFPRTSLTEINWLLFLPHCAGCGHDDDTHWRRLPAGSERHRCFQKNILRREIPKTLAARP